MTGQKLNSIEGAPDRRTNRRWTLGGLLGAALTMFGSQRAAETNRKRRKKRQRRRSRDRPEPNDCNVACAPCGAPPFGCTCVARADGGRSCIGFGGSNNSCERNPCPPGEICADLAFCGGASLKRCLAPCGSGE